MASSGLRSSKGLKLSVITGSMAASTARLEPPTGAAGLAELTVFLGLVAWAGGAQAPEHTEMTSKAAHPARAAALVSVVAGLDCWYEGPTFSVLAVPLPDGSAGGSRSWPAL